MSIRYCDNCGNKARKGRRKCNTCISREWRKNNPIKAAYHNLKSNAKRRGKDFDLTFEQFKLFVIKMDYIRLKGIKAECYHIDRIDENKGYSIDNIQLLTNSDNVKKYAKLVKNYDGGYSVQIEVDYIATYEDDCPF